MERKYYLIEECSDLGAKVADFIKRMEGINDEWSAFSDKYGSSQRWLQGRYVVGLSFDGDPPKDWYVPKGQPDGCYRPYANRSASKAAYQEFKKLPAMLGGMEFSELIGFDHTYTEGPRGGFYTHYASFEHIGDQFVITLPENGDPVPGLVPMKKSEYWALKEAA